MFDGYMLDDFPPSNKHIVAFSGGLASSIVAERVKMKHP